MLEKGPLRKVTLLADGLPAPEHSKQDFEQEETGQTRPDDGGQQGAPTAEVYTVDPQA